ncbi:HalOD1 output domain-containing protein [Natronorarus salvus]|uniref:HalOD1 output domain-containing protein n=1 Tax=Natronorarus salvus TaxID=3117733 RepID=UPI002F26D805
MKTVRRCSDPDEVAVAIVELVAERTDRDPLAVEPRLGTVVDVEALATVVASPLATGRVTFEYAGCTVAVEGDGTVRVREPVEATDD